jgi:hypothetical protein
MLALFVTIVATVRINPGALAKILTLVVPFTALANILMMLVVQRWRRGAKKRTEEKSAI